MGRRGFAGSPVEKGLPPIPLKFRTYLSPVLSTVVVVLLSFLFLPVLRPLDRQVVDVHYALRGPLPADTNIVIVYFDNDDITSLGGWPLKRNYYALLVDVLSQVGAAAVGIDVFFSERSLEFPEYDDLLVSTVERSKNVVLASYFRHIGRHADGSSINSSMEGVLYSLERGVTGSQLQLPFEGLVRAAAGVGHNNLGESTAQAIPLLVRADSKTMPAFSVELLRVYCGVSREEVRLEGDIIVFRRGEQTYQIPADEEGVAQLNFVGPISSFQMYRGVEVIRSFQHERSGLEPSLNLRSLQAKILLIGIVGEGRSTFVSSPYSETFPAIGLHATVLDNALNRRFLTDVHGLASTAIVLVLAALSTFVVLRIRATVGTAVLLGGLLLYALLSHAAFAYSNLILPLAQPTFVVFAVAGATLLLEHRAVRGTMAALQSEKAVIESSLREKELRIQTLERELQAGRGTHDAGREQELLDEIEKYKRDVKSLTAKATDLVEFEPPVPHLAEGRGEFEGIVYEKSGRTSEVIALIEKIAPSNANVLIVGESGTGKELVARAIHNRSPRRGKNFVAINCGAIPETLLESELFGHTKGAFTGATQDKAGRFEFADGGTIFLDEIAETSEAFQVKLLRVVQEGTFERLGSSQTRAVDVRIVAATNKNIKSLLQQKKFREDLYYRLNVFTVELPSLKERKSDIPVLCETFLQREGKGLALSSTVADAFLQYDWPGNVRELESAIKRGSILARADGRNLIRLKDIPPEIANALDEERDLEERILQLLREKRFSRSSISETAEELGGLNRGTVAEYLRGACFKNFFEHNWDLDSTVRAILSMDDGEAQERVRKKVLEYLRNVVEGIKSSSLDSMPFEALKESLKPKYKNLPQRYHPLLDEVIRAYRDGKWRMPG